MSYFEQVLILIGASFILAPIGVLLGWRLIAKWQNEKRK
jgi:hypothetical protein